MFSLEKFYFILYANLLKKANTAYCFFYPFGTTDTTNLMYSIYTLVPAITSSGLVITSPKIIHDHHCFYYDQEPFDSNTAEKMYHACEFVQYHQGLNMLATGEFSPEIDHWCQRRNYKNWYYFFHGFAALDWYRDYQYVPQIENQFTKVFITFNRLVTKNRSYRLYFVSQLMEKGILEKGYVSLILKDNGYGTVKDELDDSGSLLSKNSKILIDKHISTLPNSLIIDKQDPAGHASADSGYVELMMYKSALWHVVTETVFYQDKLHLTEKIFKPIVAKRPFMLLGAVGNLKYLKSYGFKTFDRWIDESYDKETDPDRRVEMIVDQLEKLCQLSTDELNQMYTEMQDILEFNFNHFYGNFKKIIIEEMLTNFKNCIDDYNQIATKNFVDVSGINFDQVQRLLSQ